MINLVLKIRFNLRYIIKTGKKNLPVVVIPYVVIDPTKMGKSPINFERKVEAFEQRPIKVDEIVPFFLSVTVQVLLATAAPCFKTAPTCPATLYQSNLPEKYVPTVKEINHKTSADLKARTVLDLKHAKRDAKKKKKVCTKTC